MIPAYEEPITVALIDDDEETFLAVQRSMDKLTDSPFILEWCPSFQVGQEAVENDLYDIYLVDSHLGERTGFDFLKAVEPEKRQAPFILLAGATSRRIEKQAMALGVSDYLVKGAFDAELLSRSLEYALGRKQAEAQRLQHLIELNQAKDDFISVASHQLRTPATGVKQYVGMLLEGMFGELTEPQQVILRKAFESNERQLRTVADLLKVARVDAGKVLLEKSETDIGQLMTEVVREETEITKEREQKVSLALADRASVARVDRDAMRMVFENLIDNASKYSEEGTTIKVAVNAQGESVSVKITDQGVGIAAKDIDRLFEKFSRIHNRLSNEAGGSGLGLYWAKKIIDLHGGTISVRSKLGKGTVFEVGLPKAP